MSPEPDRVIESLTQPGGEFELQRVVHHGIDVMTFAGTVTSLADLPNRFRAYGQAIALTYGQERISYAEFDAAVRRIANALQTELAVQPGQTVGIAMRNLPEWPIIFWASQLVGAVVVPINAWLTGPEILRVVDQADLAVLFVDTERLARVESLMPHPNRPQLVAVRDDASLDGVFRYDDLLNHPAKSPDFERPSWDSPATIMFTSGTTGVPKGVIGTHLNHASTLRSMELRARARSLASPSTGFGRVLLTFPLFHVAGLMTLSASMLAGKSVSLMRRWDLRAALDLIKTERITEFYGPPVVVRELLDAAQTSSESLVSLTFISSGGAATNRTQIDAIRDRFEGRVIPSTGYGLTETTGSVVISAGQDYFDHPEAIGRILPGVEARFTDPDGKPVGIGEVGQIELFGPMVSPGYTDSDATLQAFANGWFQTGDLGFLGADGFVRLTGRMKDVIVRGGENIFPAEVEQVLDSHPDVLESAVYGRPAEEMGEQVSLAVRARPGHVLNIDELLDYARQQLAAYKIPTSVRVWDEPLPRTATGKLMKGALAKPAPGSNEPAREATSN
jgi:long-chain acyl-CoA synthetase